MSKKHRGRFKGDPVTYQLPNPAGGVQLETFVPLTFRRRGARRVAADDRHVHDVTLLEGVWRAVSTGSILWTPAR